MSDSSKRSRTSHESRSGEPWDASYTDGPAPWQIGGPQPIVVRLASEGRFVGTVLDAGCGSGENAVHLAAHGCRVVGIDVAETALEMARSLGEGVDAQFFAIDALQLEQLGRTFDTILDCGLFHSFDEDERSSYAASLARVTRRGGMAYVLCFRHDGLGTAPHPLREDDVRSAFSAARGWNVRSLQPDTLHTRFHEHGVPAWVATIERL